MCHTIMIGAEHKLVLLIALSAIGILMTMVTTTITLLIGLSQNCVSVPV